MIELNNTPYHENCPLCNTEATLYYTPDRQLRRIFCPKCGFYDLLINSFWKTIHESRRLSYITSYPDYHSNQYYRQFLVYLRQKMWLDCINRYKEEPLGSYTTFSQYPAKVTTSMVNEALQNFNYINLADQIDNAVLAVALQEEKFFSGYYSPINFHEREFINNNNSIDMLLACLIGLDLEFDPDEQYHIIQHTNDGRGLIRELQECMYISDSGTYTGDIKHLRLTSKGWQRSKELRQGTIKSDVAFMAMEFKHCKWAYHQIFQPAVEACGFKLQTVNENPKDGSIRADIELKIKRAPFVLADLSNANNGAYWEAGFAVGHGKPVIYACDDFTWETERHFDVLGDQTIRWSKHKNESARETNALAFKNLIATIRNSITGAKMNPLKIEDEVDKLLKNKSLIYEPEQDDDAG